MSHELNRILAAFRRRPWAIEPGRGEEIAAALALRHARGPRAEPYNQEAPEPVAVASRDGRVAVLNLMGAVVPRASAVRDVSSGFASMEAFAAAFREVANDRSVAGIVLNIDSPGGMVDLVPETAATIRAARREGRPIFAVANTMAASAAYWIASQADRLYASPSALVGSIGVRVMHIDESEALASAGLKVTHIFAGPRKTEGNGQQPLDAAAQQALQDEVDATYAMFVADVAAARGVPESVVRADPEGADRHFGGGRAYHAARAAEIGMVDGIATLDEVIAMARPRRSVAIARARLGLS